MKTRPILYSAIILSIVTEIVIIVWVYNLVGGERLDSQIVRLIFEFILIAFIHFKKSNIALLFLAGYHIFSGLAHFFSDNSSEITSQIFGGYHIVIALIIYFHDSLEDILKPKKTQI